jgi:hypothetical protein
MEKNRFWESIKFFKYTEFSAPGDPESGLQINHWLVTWLDELRKITGHPMEVHQNGGFSFKGHEKNSLHYVGQACDFHFDGWTLGAREQMKIILGMGRFGGVGFYPDWKPVPGFHVDVRPGFQIWAKRKGEYVYLF